MDYILMKKAIKDKGNLVLIFLLGYHRKASYNEIITKKAASDTTQWDQETTRAKQHFMKSGTFKINRGIVGVT